MNRPSMTDHVIGNWPIAGGLGVATLALGVAAFTLAVPPLAPVLAAVGFAASANAATRMQRYRDWRRDWERMGREIDRWERSR